MEWERVGKKNKLGKNEEDGIGQRMRSGGSGPGGVLFLHFLVKIHSGQFRSSDSTVTECLRVEANARRTKRCLQSNDEEGCAGERETRSVSFPLKGNRNLCPASF